jgi:hypothetical protein
MDETMKKAEVAKQKLFFEVRKSCFTVMCAAPSQDQGRRGSRRTQPADSKSCYQILFTALSIEGHYRVPSLVGHVLKRFDAFRMEVIEIRWGVPCDRAMPLSSAGNLSHLSLA